MRTTVTLDPDVADKLKRLAHARRASFKETLNEVLRRGLSGQAGAGRAKPFKVVPHPSGFRPGVDHQRLNQLVDQLAADDFLARAGR
jgi:hypothetical protein